MVTEFVIYSLFLILNLNFYLYFHAMNQKLFNFKNFSMILSFYLFTIPNFIIYYLTDMYLDLVIFM